MVHASNKAGTRLVGVFRVALRLVVATHWLLLVMPPALGQYQGGITIDDDTGWYFERGTPVPMPGKIVIAPKARYVKQMQSVGPDKCIPPNESWKLVAESQSQCWYEVPGQQGPGDSAWQTSDGIASCQDQGGGSFYCEIRKLLGPLQIAIDVWRVFKARVPGQVVPGCTPQQDLLFCRGESRVIGSPGQSPPAGESPLPDDGATGDPPQTDQRPPGGQERSDDPDCLPAVDRQTIQRLLKERNDIVSTLAAGGYMTDLTLRTFGKLMAARLHHLTEPNEGLAVRTARWAQRQWEYAPEAVVHAAEAVTTYMTNNVEANHRYLYGQVQTRVKAAEESLKRKLREPHITIAQAADALLVGKLSGTGANVCRWTERKVAQYTKKADQALDGTRRYKRIQEMEPPPTAVCGSAREDCFWQTLANATGDRSYLLRQKGPAWSDVYEKLKQHFGGPNAKDPMTGREGDLQLIAEGIPVDVEPAEFGDVLGKLPDKSEGMAFVIRQDGSSHVVNYAKLGGSHLFWDNQEERSVTESMIKEVRKLRWYRYK
jgi:hypothetical protein